MIKILMLSLSLLSSVAWSAIEEAHFLGDWSGTISVSGQELPLVLRIVQTSAGLSGSLDSPKQGVMGIPSETIAIDNNSLTITFPSIQASFKGIMDNVHLNGNFLQMGSTFQLNFIRFPDGAAKLKRPQLPSQTDLYVSENVYFSNAEDNIVLAASLTRPRDQSPKAIVILLSGSGPQDRDQFIFGHRSFLIIADYMTRKGYAVLRFDDRGVSDSEGDFASATLENFSSDALAAVRYVQSKSRFTNLPVGFIGHSEGALIAAMAANRSSDVDFIVMLAGLGIPGYQLYVDQFKVIYEKLGYSPDKLKEKLVHLNKIVDLILSTDVRKPIADALLPHVTSLVMIDFLDKEQAKQSIIANIKIFSSPSFRGIIKSDPGKTLGNLKIPILALAGEKDLQVLPNVNLEGIRAAIAGGGRENMLTTKIMPNLNHLFQNSETGLPTEYSSIEETFSVEALNVIEEWLTLIISKPL